MKVTQDESPTVLPSGSLVPLEAILCTEELHQRPTRPPDYQAENRALGVLVRALADSPRTILQQLAEVILELVHADSAGISLLAGDEKRFYWPAIAGMWEPHIGGGTPRDFGPCGDVLDRNTPLLFRHCERRYTYLLRVTPPIEECLLVPFYVQGKAVGTIWAITHDDRRRFDAEDMRQLVSLGNFASSAHQAMAYSEAFEQRSEALRQSQTELAARVAELQKANATAEDSRRAALHLMEEAIQARQAMETLNVQLRESEERYRTLFDSAPMAVFVCDRNAVIQQYNARAVELWGREPTCGVEKHCGSTRLWLPDGTLLPHDQSPVLDVLRTGVPAHNVEVFIERPDGSRLLVLVNFAAIKNARGEVTGAITSFIDITERKRAEEELRQAEKRLRFVMDSMPQKIFTAKPNGDVDYFNAQWTEFTGLTFEQIRDWGWTQFIHPDDVAENVRIWQRSIDTGEPFQFEHRFRLADGEYRWHISRALPMWDAHGRIVMWIGSSTEVHEQRQTANKLQQLAAELSESDRRKNEFLAMLAHELRNPLAPIRNALQVMRLTGGNGETVHSAFEMMERQVGQMVRLVDDLLDVSRISRGKIELREERVELASVIYHAVEACRPAMECAEHDLSITLPPQPVYLNADATRLAQVVGNLLNNACKFTDKGGRIWLTVEREGEQAVIRVRDTGIGIPGDELSRVFEIFKQVDTSLERSVSGLGIGLTLVKNVVEMHGGTVEAYSAGVGQGSELVVRLPIMVETPKPPPEQTASEPTTTIARRILVVDDNPDSAESLATLLQISGNETHIAHDGLQALEAAERFRPDVVLLDIGLPRLNGYDACRRIREQPWGKTMVLIALTGWGQEEDRRQSKDAGFDAHLVKPVDYGALTELLATLPSEQGG